MTGPSEHDLFAPTVPGGRKRAIALAVLAHIALIAALTWGVNWKSSADQPAVEAELWSAVPQQAAPRPTAPPPAPPPAPEPKPEPAPEPAPAPAPPPPKVQEAPQPSEADIALEREKKRQEEEKQRQARLEQEKRAQEEKAHQEAQERQRQEKLAAQKAKAEKEKAEKEKAEKEKLAREKAEREKAEKEKAEKEKQRKLAEEKRKAEAEAKRAEALRQEQLKRIAGLAGASGSPAATGSALQSSGPSGSYAGKVAAKVRPNIVYPDSISGNPRAEVEVRAAPDGTIVGTRITKSSGNPAWDDAVLRALSKTETLPRDVDGRVPSALIIGFRPKD
ncbi:cell envelope integrity protein TolA [Comamonas sp. NLF-1-9]|uniref:cell envelope integrity protein TolA n=1 Tax=Comamonas sp. NLF-1-9 TaxID=2853163 RepID=UPI001C4874F7|nr:cell envelope integrity protein TolA [Comamonas sp. NLF-1-9]QXL85791.1 cell envelope integrity protein TolA [Comamonas sp. NLF-1-9]